MKVLILGGEGMLGHKVYQVLSRRFGTYATFKDARGLWTRYPMYANALPSHCFGGVDVMSFDNVIQVAGQVRPDVVINCVGIVKQLEEAHDPILTLQLNSLFPHRLAGLCAATGARMLHMSTDCVFSGRKGQYAEEDVPDPEDLYGRTKLLGEVNRPGCLTIRTSIFGRDFLKLSALLEWFLSQRGGRVKGYRHAIYTGFPTQVLARIMGDIIAGHPDLSGLYQIASQPISKYELLVRIRDAMKLDIEVEPYDDLPCDRSLSASRFVAATGYRIPGWDEMIAELAADPTPYDDWRRQYGTA
jgi:dTDP-4-dehydrorhamnose reductase